MRGTRHWTVVAALAIGVGLWLGLWWWNARSAASYSQYEKLAGRWQRADGGYVLAIKSIGGDGALDAAYYNPRSIHIAKAEAARDSDATKVFIELRDVNYPGSTYTLAYDAASDRLNGAYYQAVEKQRFPVTFRRLP
jgi:hypothetical protein